MGLFVGSTPVKQVYVGSTPVKAVYVGSQKVWPTIKEVVQITLGAGMEARDQFRAALSARGLNYRTVTEIPFDIELVGSGSAQFMFFGCSDLTSVPDLNTSSVTNMNSMFRDCSSLVSVPDLNTSSVTDMYAMFYGCAALTDGNVRLIGKHPNVNTTLMIDDSGLTREPWYNADGTPDDGPTIEVHEVTLTNVRGSGTLHPMVSVTPPAGQTWDVQVTGTMTKAYGSGTSRPRIQIGGTTSEYFSEGATVDVTGTITSSSATIALLTSTSVSGREASFVGTVTITK